MDENRPEIEIGASIGGCSVVGLIGRGGMGAVYEAHQVSLDRRVAVKVLLLSGKVDKEDSAALFLKEARLVARLNHPNIVQIFDVGRQDDLLYMIMEYVEGVTLKDLLQKQPVFPIDRLYRVARKVSHGLAAAHKENIVHRDVKPENVLLTSYGEVKIADFGAASFLLGEEENSDFIIGTPRYMAPEVIQRQPFDGRSDVYALGLILYAAAAGGHPYPLGETKEILRCQVQQAVPPLRGLRPELHPGFAALIEKLCAKKPHLRLSSEELMRELDRHPEWEREEEDRRGREARGGEKPAPAEEAAACPAGAAGGLELTELPTRKFSVLDAPLVRQHPSGRIKRSESGSTEPAGPAAAAATSSTTPPVAPSEPGPASSTAQPAAPPDPGAGWQRWPTPMTTARRHPKKPPRTSVGAQYFASGPGGQSARDKGAPADPPGAGTTTAGAAAASTASTGSRVNELCIQARFQVMKKRWGQAEEIFNKALALDPDNETALLGLSRVLTEQGRLDDAVAILSKAMAKGTVAPEKILDSQFFAALKQHKEFRRLMAEHSL